MARSVSFSLLMQFQFISVYCLFFFACKDTMRSEGGLGNNGTSVEIKRLTGKWRTICAPDNISGNGHTFEPESDSGLIDEEKNGIKGINKRRADAGRT